MNIHKISNHELFRKNVVEKLDTIIKDVNKSVNLEKGIYNWSIKESTIRKVIKKWDNQFFIMLYLDHLKSVYVNLSNNNYLLELLNENKIKAHEIAFMTHQEMNPEIWEELIRRKSIRDKSKFEDRLEASTDAFTCRKCRSKKCSYYAQQVRSSDEPMTLFISCLNCGNRWKQN